MISVWEIFSLHEFSLHESLIPVLIYPVYVCDGIDQNANTTVLSGYVSSDPPSATRFTPRTTCTTVIRRLPPNTSVKFNVKDLFALSSSGVKYPLTIGNNQTPVVRDEQYLRMSDASGRILVESKVDGDPEDGTELIRFNVKYTGECKLWLLILKVLICVNHRRKENYDDTDNSCCLEHTYCTG